MTFQKQKQLANWFQNNSLLNIACPTGFGKGYVMINDIIRRFTETDENLILIATHRLALNNQHLTDTMNRVKDDNIGNISFIINGSGSFNFKEYAPKRISTSDFGVTVSSKEEMNLQVDRLLELEKKIVIITTYHSLINVSDLKNIDVAYFDEAHTLVNASEAEKDFEKSYNKIKDNCKNKFFLTATPKDTKYDNGFALNNKEIFGERVGFTYDECREDGYVTNLKLHTIYPEDIDIKKFKRTPKNQAILINRAYTKHTELVKRESYNHELIDTKLLIKCDGIINMNDTFNELIELYKGTDIKLMCGASSDGYNGREQYRTYENGRESTHTKDEYMQILYSFKDTDKCIVLHVDTLSEGINVSGFTGIMFLTENIPTAPKLIQNVGRAMRLCKYDKMNWINGKITGADYEEWVKPNCYIIIPFFDDDSKVVQQKMRELIIPFRDNNSLFSITVQIGNDIGNTDGNYADEIFNTIDQFKKVKTDYIDKVINDIEKEKEDHEFENMSVEEANDKFLNLFNK